MEEGSLLQQALDHQEKKRKTADDSRDEKNKSWKNPVDLSSDTLIIDLFLLSVDSDCRSHLLRLAQISDEGNRYIQAQNHQWHVGGDGPVFGIHVSDGVPHLRALCVYGPNVLDEWAAISYLFAWSAREGNESLAFSFWDVDDGQVLLIQLSEHLPEWIDQDPTDSHRHSCWIRGGHIELINGWNVKLDGALQAMENGKSVRYPALQMSLNTWLNEADKNSRLRHKSVLAVPQAVAGLIKTRSDLVNAAFHAFFTHINAPPPHNMLKRYEGWVWATFQMTRTTYAMARTIVASSSSGKWDSSSYIPSPISAEVKQIKRLCAVESTPHLRHALELGVRLLAGLEYLVMSKIPISNIDMRLACWNRIDLSTCEKNQNNTVCDGQTWIVKSFQAGPNNSKYDLKYLLKCPVYPEELGNLTLFTNFDVPIKSQIFQAMKFDNDATVFGIPLSSDVDTDESWMTVDDNERRNGENPSGSELDSMLSRFRDFLVQPSGAEGVHSSEHSPLIDIFNPVRPRVFVNILDAVLKGEDLSFPVNDAYFCPEDYDLSNGGDVDDEIAEVMTEMDSELAQKTSTRLLDAADGGKESGGHNRGLVEETHVLTNLLQSIEASGGSSGPVPNILKEMGSDVPKI